MSSRNWPGSGYLVKCSKFKQFFKENLSEKDLAELYDGLSDGSDVLDIVNPVFEKHKLPVVLDTLIFSSSDDIDEHLEYDEYYFYFDEGSLYKKVPTSALNKLIKLYNINPKFSQYSIWG